MSKIEKVIIITGASSGIGEATARLLASRGAKLMLAARREENLIKLVADIKSAGGDAAYCVTDVTSREQVEALAQATLQHFGGIDTIINNAGLMPLSPLDQLKVDEWDRMVDVNIKGVLYGIAAVLPHMRDRKEGHVINISSVAGHKVFPSAAVYCGTKFAVRAISEGLRQESNGEIRVTTISPGAVATELTNTTSDPAIRDNLNTLYADALDSNAIARAIAFAIEQPHEVDINEIVIRPVTQEL